jgi:hypothetical protein
MSFKNIGILNCLFGVKQIVDIVFNKNMIAKTLARRLLNQQSVFNFAKAASTQTSASTTPRRGQISQVIGAVVDVQFEG